jgi:hypothetical protein
MLPLPISPNFFTRAQSMMQAAVAEFGGQRAAARALNIPISTLRANITGQVTAARTMTVARLADAFQTFDMATTQRLRGGTDLLAGLDPAAARTAWEQLSRDPAAWRGATDYFNDVWHGEQRRREEQGAPPLDSGSP